MGEAGSEIGEGGEQKGLHRDFEETSYCTRSDYVGQGIGWARGLVVWLSGDGSSRVCR